MQNVSEFSFGSNVGTGVEGALLEAEEKAAAPSPAQRCRYAWFHLPGLDRLGKDAHSEFTSYYVAYHGLGYGIGPGILVWDISRKGMRMHDGRVNAWDWFYRKYRRYSKRWNSPDAVLKRAAAGEAYRFWSEPMHTAPQVIDLSVTELHELKGA